MFAAGETIPAEDAADAFAALNRLVDQWASERLEIYSIVRTTWPIVSGTGSYTVGSGGTVNIARPVFPEHVAFQDTSPTITTEYPLQPFTDDAYAGIQLKTITSPFPQGWYYNPTYPLGTLSLWPVPTSTTLQGVIYAPTAVSQFALLTTTVALPPAYGRAIVKNLAVELMPSYSKQPDPILLNQATEAKAAVKRANYRPSDLGFGYGGHAGHWDIRTGP